MADVERIDDGRYIVVGGRRWRATDPNLPESLRKELVAELMDARRQVKTARPDPEALKRVRARVQNAKVALGERGQPWWEPAPTERRTERTRATVLALLTKRGVESSICPSDAARIVASPDWREAMHCVRAVAAEMASEGSIRITQGDRTVDDATSATGPLRLRLPQAML